MPGGEQRDAVLLRQELERLQKAPQKLLGADAVTLSCHRDILACPASGAGSAFNSARRAGVRVAEPRSIDEIRVNESRVGGRA
jgi:hypothetical protein